MTPENSHRVIIGCTVLALGAITWGEVKVNHTAPPPSRYVGAGVLYGMLDVATPALGDELAATLAVGVTIVLVYRGLGTKASSKTPTSTSTGSGSDSKTSTKKSSGGTSVGSVLGGALSNSGIGAGIKLGEDNGIPGKIIGGVTSGVKGLLGK